MSSAIFDNLDLGSSTNYLENEIEILKSRSTSERAIATLLKGDFKNELYLFNTKKHNDGTFRKIFRTILFLNNDVTKNIDLVISDSLFNIFVERLRENISVSNIRNTDILKILYSSSGSEEAAYILNTLVNEYQTRDQEWASGEMSHLKYFLGEQLDIKEKERN